MSAAAKSPSAFLELYRYIPFMNGEQIWKLRKIAIGILGMDAFSPDEIHELEMKLVLDQEQL